MERMRAKTSDAQLLEGGVERVGEWMSDGEGDDGDDEWRTVRPKGEPSSLGARKAYSSCASTDKELRRYLVNNPTDVSGHQTDYAVDE